MGRDKALLPFGAGETMLQRVVRLVAEAVPRAQIVCVAAPDQRLPPVGIRVARDSIAHCGPLAGLAAGLSALETAADAVFVCGCDVPRLVPAFVSRMFDLLGDHEIVVPHDGRRLHPLAAVYRRGVLRMAESLLAAEERSLAALVARCQSFVVPIEQLREVDPELHSLSPCNTLDEYHQALAQANEP